jgi:methyltransferase (TIGR00027 family)
LLSDAPPTSFLTGPKSSTIPWPCRLSERKPPRNCAPVPKNAITLWLAPFVAARSRYAEDQLAQAVEQRVAQYVVLGAGLDTFAYRNPHAAYLRVFEVDRPATQAWKLERLQAAGIAVPPELQFVPVDFERQTLATGLEQGGFDSGSPAFLSWLGVTPYLTRESCMATLRFIA